MTQLHETLADLARDHGRELFENPEAFRGALDDYLDEGAASAGTINLLNDAVRLGALSGLLSMLDSGASPQSAIESAGSRLARDRGTTDERSARWALAALGHAVGRVPAEVVGRYDPDMATQLPPPQPQPGATPAAPPPPAAMPGPPPPPPTAPRKSRTGLFIGLAVGAVLLLVVGIGAVVALVSIGGDSNGDDPKADSESSEVPASDDTEAIDDIDTDAFTIYGTNYTYGLPDGWNNVTYDLDTSSSSVDTVAAWGEELEGARANFIVTTGVASGYDDAADLEDDWKDDISSDTGADLQDIDDIEINGEKAVGIRSDSTNDNDIDITQIGYLVIHDGTWYSIIASFKQDEEEPEHIFYAALDSWEWS